MSNYTNPSEWGPHFWYVMKCVAHNYNNADKRETRRFFEDIGTIIPCEKCRRHYKLCLRKYPLDDGLCCSECLKNWVNLVQSDINKNNR